MLWVCFFKEDPLVTPLKNWWSSTRNSSLTQGSRFGYAGQSEMKWNALSAYLSNEIERVQMRALMIKYRRSYCQEALQLAKITRLEDRRNELCMRTFGKVAKGGPLPKHVTQTRTIARDYVFSLKFQLLVVF